MTVLPSNRFWALMLVCVAGCVIWLLTGIDAARWVAAGAFLVALLAPF